MNPGFCASRMRFFTSISDHTSGQYHHKLFCHDGAGGLLITELRIAKRTELAKSSNKVPDNLEAFIVGLLSQIKHRRKMEEMMTGFSTMARKME